MTWEDSKIFLANEDEDGYGFVCSKEGTLVYSKFWSKNESKLFSYLDKYSMYNTAIDFCSSQLIGYTELHKAQYRMFQHYIAWYEKELHK